MQFKHTSSQRGFSLVELAVVLVIIGIMGAVAFPMFTTGPDKRLRAATRTLWADIRFARMEAVKRRINIKILFPPGLALGVAQNNQYTIFIDNGGGTPANANNNRVDPGEAILRTVLMPSDVNFLGHNFPATTNSIQFNSRALPIGVMGTIQLQSQPNPTRMYQLILSQAGAVRIQRTNPDGSWKEY